MLKNGFSYLKNPGVSNILIKVIFVIRSKSFSVLLKIR